ncbi:uncharacterized protein LOC122820426 [Gambusia affinis]|uniref:uncharacterized protein LOC122820426 n=1 Tax=Gambusia affinis TaxID=33528 RepID=UPI001CDCEFBE|nr:uncharacterized protein LOC122820426 [Gambusia affinis]XP_043953760.1 uncharacterized protein LOC122820426 [Gambusia affinis]XP_043953761.1 uncharacterized protein LOC122820426 [Gambusia affinis]XP_043953762.1 uncharacterized protein LOC122820426 [Gambusia affinis]XP_043953763.1 uncharacterized protein LOC122820426 [Gambusia affinis]
MIRSLPPQPKAKWPQILQLLTFCYNCTEHETTGFAPFYLVFGRIPRLPVDVMFQHALNNDIVVNYSDFVSHLKKDLHEAAQIVQKNSLKEQTRHANLYNRKFKGSPLVIGDRVLIANRGVPGKRKIADKWESTPYEVISVKPDINVYKVKDVLTGRERVVHRNLLLSVSFLPCESAGDHESDSTAAMHGSGLYPDVPDVMEDSDVRTVNWLMQSGDDGTHSDDDDSLDRESCAIQSDSLSVVTSSPTSHPIPVHNIGHSTVDDIKDPKHCPDMVITPTNSVHPDVPSPDKLLIDIDTPVTAAPDGDCSDTALPDSLTQTVSTQLDRRILRDRSSIRPPRRLICEMNNQTVDETSLSAVSVSSLIQFFSNAFSI